MKQCLFLFVRLVVISLYFFIGNLNCYAQLSDDSSYAFPTNLNTLLSMGEKELSDVSQKTNLTFLINSKTDLQGIQRLERFEQLKIVFENNYPV